MAQTTNCVSDVKQMNLLADFQTASLVCPKWNVLSRVDYAWMMVSLGLIEPTDLLKSDAPGKVEFREECADEIGKYESESFRRAELMGLDTFCIKTSAWLTVPNVRQALEENGAFPTGRNDQ